MRWQAGRPQLKREPLGSRDATNILPVHNDAMTRPRWLLASALILLGRSTPSRAQGRGGWGVLGLGTGTAHVACDGCTSGWNQGPTLLGTVGVMFTSHLGVGLGLDEWWRDPDHSEATNTGTVLVHYYPKARGGAFAEAGAGLSEAEVNVNGTTAKGKGWALMASVGYDLPFVGALGGAFGVTPRVSYVYSSVGDLRYASGSAPYATGWRHQVVSVGIGLALVE